jgi:diguanylate cyclase (GGDEF)-like protein
LRPTSPLRVVPPKHPARRARKTRPTRSWLPGGLGALLLAVGQMAGATPADDIDALLLKADRTKSADPVGFAALLDSLLPRIQELTPAQQEMARYLLGYKSAWDGQYDLAIQRFQATIRETHDVTLKFRANASIINVLLVGSHYEEALTQLSQLLTLLPKVTDHAAREQGLIVAAELYNEVGQYDLGLTYSQALIDENWLGRGVCKGMEEKLRAEVANGKLHAVGPEFEQSVDACTKQNELGYGNFIRTYAAKLYIANDEFDEAIRMLTEHYGEALDTHYRHLISNYESLLAEAYQKKGDFVAARQFALRTVDSAVPNAITQPQAIAYRVLYEQAKHQGDYKSALEYHEMFAVADKGYLDVISARQLAYQRVAHETIANRLQIETLNKENHVLQLEQALGAKAIENSRLYIMLLLLVVGFVGLWAYRTKRLQLHFMSLSQIDGLTGIANRPHFLEQAEARLQSAARARQPVCIILCDLDHFKSVNDKHGHAAGDQVLRQAVTACQAHLRPGDLFGRFGGEEFSFLLAGCSLEQARQRAEQLRLTIAGISVGDAGDSYASASFGLASTISSGYDLRQLLAHADAALYTAKRAGRNRVAVYEGVPMVAMVDTTSQSEVNECPSSGPDLQAAKILGIAGS